MSLNLLNLDSLTRQHMLDEINADIAAGRLYVSNRLNAQGRQAYPRLLKEAAQLHDDSWLAAQLRVGGNFNDTEQRNTKRGLVTAQIPVTAPDTLAEGEFNRYYLCGLCLRAIQQKEPSLIIYRAKLVDNPRPDSEMKIGSHIDPIVLLNDVRTHPGVDTALGLPPGPNSGLSAKLP